MVEKLYKKKKKQDYYYYSVFILIFLLKSDNIVVHCTEFTKKSNNKVSLLILQKHCNKKKKLHFIAGRYTVYTYNFDKTLNFNFDSFFIIGINCTFQFLLEIICI